jgi:hypothetical protein
MLRVAFAIFVAAFSIMFAWPRTASAADDTLVRFNGPVHIQTGERAGSVFVVRGNATVDGTVGKTLFVTNGDADVRGQVDGDIAVIKGRLLLRDGARVRNVHLIDASIVREPGAVVSGTLTMPPANGRAPAARGIAMLVWLGMTVTAILAAALYEWTAGRHLDRASEIARVRPGRSLVGALVVWFVIPVVALGAIVSLVGAPFGIALLMLVIPALWIVGYLVSGAALGTALLSATHRAWSHDRPFLPAILGVLALQVLALLPIVGPFIVLVAGVIGAGSLAALALRNAMPRTFREPQPA